MFRRLGALLLVSAVATAPAMLTACEIVCAVRDGHRRGGDSASTGHSCHGSLPSLDPGVDAGVQICGHDQALLAASQTPPLSTPTVAVVAPSMFVLLDAAWSHAHVVLSRPGHHTVPLPLRI
jgi:hypothetical protein